MKKAAMHSSLQNRTRWTDRKITDQAIVRGCIESRGPNSKTATRSNTHPPHTKGKQESAPTYNAHS